LPHVPGLDNGGTTTPATISGAAAFDPFGGNSENNSDAPLAVDGDASTFWQTEGYNSPAIQIKPGVGLIVTLSAKADLASVAVTSQTDGWSVQIYVADSPKPTLDAWGDPVTEKQGIAAGTTTLDLGGRNGGAVLVWMTNLGNGSPGDEPGRFHGQIAEVTIKQK
jgi:hypothetical protein